MSFALSRHVESSNLSRGHKSALQGLFDSVRNGADNALESVGMTRRAAAATGHSLLAGGEALLVGGALGIAHAELANGLDIDGKVPLDGVVGAAGLALSIVMAGDEAASHALRNAGADALAICAFRKSFGIYSHKMTAAGRKVGGTFAGEGGEGDSGEDPIELAARQLTSR